MLKQALDVVEAARELKIHRSSHMKGGVSINLKKEDFPEKLINLHDALEAFDKEDSSRFHDGLSKATLSPIDDLKKRHKQEIEDLNKSHEDELEKYKSSISALFKWMRSEKINVKEPHFIISSVLSGNDPKSLFPEKDKSDEIYLVKNIVMETETLKAEINADDVLEKKVSSFIVDKLEHLSEISDAFSDYFKSNIGFRMSIEGDIVFLDEYEEMSVEDMETAIDFMSDNLNYAVKRIGWTPRTRSLAAAISNMKRMIHSVKTENKSDFTM